MKFNMNDTVRVKLTDEGRRICTEAANVYESIGRLIPSSIMKHFDPPRPVEEDEDGWSEWQLWVLMQEFGPHMCMGGPLLFEAEVELVRR